MVCPINMQILLPKKHFWSLDGTDITTGFDVAKQAMGDSKYHKKKITIIYFSSDGAETQGGTGYTKR